MLNFASGQRRICTVMLQNVVWSTTKFKARISMTVSSTWIHLPGVPTTPGHFPGSVLGDELNGCLHLLILWLAFWFRWHATIYNPKEWPTAMAAGKDHVWVPEESAPNGGAFNTLPRTASHSGFCGRPKSPVMKPYFFPGQRNNEFLPIPDSWVVTTTVADLVVVVVWCFAALNAICNTFSQFVAVYHAGLR